MKRVDIFFVLLIAVLTFIIWHGIVNRSLNGDGYYYFAPTVSLFSANGKLSLAFSNFDNFPRIINFILEKLFAGNMRSYMAAVLGIVVIINISIYIFIKKVTKNQYIAFLSSIYAGLNYTADYTFYANGTLQWVWQRVPELIPVFVSFWFLIKFSTNRKAKDYFLSLTFFVLAMLMTHYTIFFLPFIPVYAVVFSFLKIKGIKNKLINIALSLPFIVIGLLLVKGGGTMPISVFHRNTTLWQSLLPTKDTFPQISFQLVVTTIPFGLLQALKEHLPKYISYKELVFLLTIPVYLFYLAVFVYLYKRKFKYFDFVLASFFALICAEFLNIYTKRYDVYQEIERGRYLFIPAIYVGPILASFLVNVVKQFKAFLLITIILAVMWILSNANLIKKNLASTQYSHTGGILALNKLAEQKNNFPDDAIVLLPSPIMPCGEAFLAKYYGGKNTRFFVINSKLEDIIPPNFDRKKLFVFDYNDEAKKGFADERLKKIKIVDRSEEYRQKLHL